MAVKGHQESQQSVLDVLPRSLLNVHERQRPRAWWPRAEEGRLSLGRPLLPCRPLAAGAHWALVGLGEPGGSTGRSRPYCCLGLATAPASSSHLCDLLCHFLHMMLVSRSLMSFITYLRLKIIC